MQMQHFSFTFTQVLSVLSLSVRTGCLHLRDLQQHRTRHAPAVGLRRFGSTASRFDNVSCRSDRHRHKAHAGDGHGHGRDVSWLVVEDDARGPFRLAYRHRRALAVPCHVDCDGAPSTTAAAQADGESARRIAVLFCNGFRSAMTGGTKARALEDHCARRGWDFCAFDYRGHGRSAGARFEECTLTDWIADAARVLDVLRAPGGGRREARASPAVVLVGSSMGAWIALHLASRRNHGRGGGGRSDAAARPVGGILGIAAAHDFLQDLYASSSPERRAAWRAEGVARFPSRYGDPYPVTWKQLEDAWVHWGVGRSVGPLPTEASATPSRVGAAAATLSVRCPVRLLHGKRDQDVSWRKSRELLDLLKESKTPVSENGDHRGSTDVDADLTLIEDGEHRLSRPQDVDLILATLDDMVTGLEQRRISRGA